MVDDETLTIDQLIALLQGLPDKGKKVWCSVEGGCVREGIIGVSEIRDNEVILNTTGN